MTSATMGSPDSVGAGRDARVPGIEMNPATRGLPGFRK